MNTRLLPATLAGLTLGTFVSTALADDFTADFEDGYLRGWTKTGTAFDTQPTLGDNPTARGRGQPSNHQGNWWIGTHENYQGGPGQTPGDIQGDTPTGSLTSPPFLITGEVITFLIGGGNHNENDPAGATMVVIEVQGVRTWTFTGANSETMTRVQLAVGLSKGMTAVIKIIDENSGWWGHVNCDDFQMLDAAGHRLPFAANPSPPDQPALAVRPLPSGPDWTTTSTTFTTIRDSDPPVRTPNSSLTGAIFTEDHADLKITFSGEIDATMAGGRVFLRALVDGEAASPADIVAAIGKPTGVRSFAFTKTNLPAGWHWVEIQWCTDSGITAQLGDASLTLFASSAANPAAQVLLTTPPSGGWLSTAATYWTEVPDTTGSLVTPTAGNIAITFTAEAFTGGGSSMFVRALVDGQAASPSDVEFVAEDFAGTRSFTFVKQNVPAGLHVIAIQWHASGGLTSYLSDRTLSVVAAPQLTSYGGLTAQAAPSGPDQTTTSATWTDMPDAPAFITTAADSSLEATFSAELNGSGNGRVFVRALVDGQPAQPTDVVFVVGESWGTRSFTFTKAALSAGTHEVRMQWKVDSGTTGYLGDHTLALNYWRTFVRHVRQGGAGDGSSWANALGDVQQAIEACAAAGGGQVWVAAGTYKPTSEPNPETAGIAARRRHFSLRNGVKVYGGFTATGDPGLPERDPSLHETTLSGDLSGDDTVMRNGLPDTATMTENCYHVFYHPATLALDATAVLDGFTIRGGYAGTGASWYLIEGGGMLSNAASPTIARCVFKLNAAAGKGGGIQFYYGTPSLTNCVMTDNLAPYGGAIHSAASSPTLANCVLARNFAPDGAAIFNQASSPTLVNCVLANNLPGGGAVRSTPASSPTLANSILWANGPNPVVDDSGAAATLNYCIIEGGWRGAGTGNLSADPQLVNLADPDGPDNRWFTDDDGLRPSVALASPALDAADYAPLAALHDPADLDGDGNTLEALPFDLRGGPRVAGGQLDIGAYEIVYHFVIFDLAEHAVRTGGGTLEQKVEHGSAPVAPTLQVDFGWDFDWNPALAPVTGDGSFVATYSPAFDVGDTVHVRTDGTPGADGKTWATATPDLQGAIDILGQLGGGQVWVAAGTYKPTSEPNPEAAGLAARRLHFSLRNGVKVYGGFPATGDPGLPERNPAVHETTLSGDLSGNDAVLPNGRPDIATMAENCYHVLYHPAPLALQSTVLDGFTIRGGYAGPDAGSNTGGGMLYAGSAMIANCVFKLNAAAIYGGGVMFSSGTPSLTNCVVANNSTDGNGGGIYFLHSFPTLVNCVLTNNSAGVCGGGIYSYYFQPSLVNCLLANNSAGTSGGGIFNSFSSPSLGNCVLANNSALSGGAVGNESASSPTLANSILWGNGTNPVVDGAGSASTLNYCIIEGGWSGAGGNHTSANPQFVSLATPAGADGRWRTADDGLRLQPGSPGIDTGSNALVPAGTPTDLLGNPRIIGAAVDRGAYELPVTLLPQSYAAFAAYYGLTTPAGGDQDHDGYPNVVEYALALNPNLADSGSPGVPRFTKAGAVDSFFFEMPAASAPDLGLMIEASTDLMVWTVLATRTAGGPWSSAFPLNLVPTAPGMERVVLSRPDGGAPKRFYRLAVRLDSGVPPGFAEIPAGEFLMGDSIGDG
ncbi:MAG: right-handed parallel beta-helix repeat-containing protein [Verrucomicrobia bacterium]|nr:right-handed parallel beta-helix repeat-containing protein [Verrucomicrobiota bacterium]